LPSKDLLRNASDPVCQNETPWENAVVARERVCILIRLAMVVATGSL
jgi:hypothetical protein